MAFKGKIFQAMNYLRFLEKRIHVITHQKRANPEETVGSALEYVREYEEVKRRIDYTNILSKVRLTVDGKEEVLTIHELLTHNRRSRETGEPCGTGAIKRKIWNAVAPPERRDKETKKLDELDAQIETALQLANAQLDLMELPEDRFYQITSDSTAPTAVAGEQGHFVPTKDLGELPSKEASLSEAAGPTKDRVKHVEERFSP